MQGLANLGFTCAINSLIQIICRNDLMRDTILNYEINDNSLLNNLKEILILMHVEKKSVAPKKFVAKLYSTFSNIFNYGEQIDITELWIFINQKIISEINEDPNYYKLILDFDNIKINNNNIINGTRYDTELDYKNALKNSNSLNEKFAFNFIQHNQNKISIWQQITQGFILNITTCKKCNDSLFNFEPFCALYLNIPDILGDAENISIASVPNVVEMITNLFKENHNTNDWTCEKCKCKTEYVKSTKIWSLPNILFVIINRFINPDIKNNSPININADIFFSKGTVLSDSLNEKKYKLSSLALHIGGVSSGHYTAICNTDDAFILYDDIHISKIDNFLENNKNAYMLSYSLLS
jgi:ubiquitin C-terminal hydrolase